MSGPRRPISGGIIDAAMYFDLHRLPELFAGCRREEYGRPVPYPVADHPQAWGAGSVPFLVETMLGLEPGGFERRLCVRRPMLPGILSRVDVRGLRVGAVEVDLTFEREGDGVVVTSTAPRARWM